MSLHPQLSADIKAFAARSGMSPITVGRKALNDPNFVRDLDAGRRVWPATEAKVRNFMAAIEADLEQERAAA